MRARLRLGLLCAGLNVAESALVLGIDKSDAPSLATQASAIAPFGAFHDLRWVSVYQDSWLTFALELVAMLLIRGFITAVCVRWAWPATSPSPSLVTGFGQGILATAVSAFFVAPCVALLFGLAVVPISWLFIAAVPLVLLVALVVHPIAVSGSWWRRALAPRALWWVFVSFAVLDLAAIATDASPGPVRILVAAASGVFNAWAWIGLVSAVVDRRPARHVVPMVPVALAVLAGIVIGGALLGFNGAHPVTPVYNDGPSPGSASATPVLLVSGYGSEWDGQAVHPIPGNFYEIRFSYSGLSADGQPLPYTSHDTVKSLAALDKMLGEQIDALHDRTHRRIDVVAESEGSLIAETYLLATQQAPVDSVVYASPLISPGRVWYPTGSQGWGVASVEGMQILSDAFQSVAPIDLSPDSAFLKSLDMAAPTLQSLYSCSVPGVRQFALLPLADSVAMPADTTLGFPYAVVPAFHGGLTSSPAGAPVIAEALEHGSASTSSIWRYMEDAFSAAASAWQVPNLAETDYPGGKAQATSCDAVGKALASYIRSAS